MPDTSVPITAGVGTAIATELHNSLYYQAFVPGVRYSSPMTEFKIDITASGDTDLVALTAGQIIKVYGLFLASQGAVDVILKDGTTPTELFPLVSLTGKGASWMLPRDSHIWCQTAAAAKLTLNCSAAIRVTGRLYYVKEA